jgi:hypothetical protein
MILDFLNNLQELTFWIALGIGMLIAYILAPTPKVIYRYPTPENAGKVTYADKGGVCYRYEAIPVACPADPSIIQPMHS